MLVGAIVALVALVVIAIMIFGKGKKSEIDKYLATGDYEITYEKAKNDAEKDAVLFENEAAYCVKMAFNDSLISSYCGKNFELLQYYYNQEDDKIYAVVKLSSSNYNELYVLLHKVSHSWEVVG